MTDPLALYDYALFDSGIGGLWITRELLNSYSFEIENTPLRCLYIGDTLYAPYGQKTLEDLFTRFRFLCHYIVSLRIKKIVIACNTVTTQLITQMRQEFPEVTFYGIEPFLSLWEPKHEELRKKKQITKDHSKILLLSTQGTSLSQRCLFLQELYKTQDSISIVPMPSLAMKIEYLVQRYWKNEILETSYMVNFLKEELEILKTFKATHLILGCTHYSFLGAFFENFQKLQVIDPTDFLLKEIAQKEGLKKIDTPANNLLEKENSLTVWFTNRCFVLNWNSTVWNKKIISLI